VNPRRRRNPSKVEPPFLAKLYLEEVRYSRSIHTFNNYQLDIERRFVPYLERLGVDDIAAVTRAHCAGFISYEGTRGVSESSIRKSFDCMRRFLNWCVESDYLESSPAEKMKPPRMPHAMRIGFTREEVQALLGAAKEARGFLRYRDYAIVLLLLGTGLRAQGLLSLTVSQLTAPDYRAHHRLLVREKGGRDRLIPVGRNSHKALQAYLAVRPHVASDALWIDLRRNRWSIPPSRPCSASSGATPASTT